MTVGAGATKAVRREEFVRVFCLPAVDVGRTCGHHSGAALTRRSLKQILTAEAGLGDTKRKPDESAAPILE